MIKNIGINSEFHSTSTPLPAGYLSLYHTHLAYWCSADALQRIFRGFETQHKRLLAFLFPHWKRLQKRDIFQEALKMNRDSFSPWTLAV